MDDVYSYSRAQHPRAKRRSTREQKNNVKNQTEYWTESQPKQASFVRVYNILRRMDRMTPLHSIRPYDIHLSVYSTSLF